VADLTDYCAPGTVVKEEMVAVDDSVSLRVIAFTPPREVNHPTVIFVPGWVSLISGWKIVLREMTRDFPVYYIETREKVTSHINGKVRFGVEEIGLDLVHFIDRLNLSPRRYILFGSSLGATAILDCYRHLTIPPLCLVLLGPNAVFRVPRFGKVIIWLFPPRLYPLIKPVVKWYLKTFRLDVESDWDQYAKYCRALDNADPRKLKPAALTLAKYKVWDILAGIDCPTLIVGASKDLLHEPQNLERIVDLLPQAEYLDMETNFNTHSVAMMEEMRRYLATLKDGSPAP
jgi:pimeloyl-ACP methyl ester carboxylesterase